MTYADFGGPRCVDVSRVRAAIGSAAQRSGVDFSYLLAQAKSESGLDPSARATGSTAAGLYQFLDSSWLGVVKAHGSAAGLGWAADAITAKPGGGYTVDPSLRPAVMALRQQPEASAAMAAAYAADNASGLTAALGRQVSGADLYMAHFLGLSGATKFLRAADQSPGMSAAALFPREAAANRSIFYDRSGSARSLAEVKAVMAGKLGDGAAVAAIDAQPAPASAAAFGQAQAGFTLASLQGDGGTAANMGSTTTDQALALQANHANLVRPSPATARLAYLLLTTLGTGPSSA